MNINAPFNFVPLPDKVFLPEWRNDISHDIPFAEGLCGCINLKFKSETPIFVRNGHTQSDEEEKNETYESFSRMDRDEFFIPGTTMKGTFRSVLEAMSCCKMGFTENQSFGWRNLNDNSYSKKVRNARCGWMKLDGNGGAIIEDWGEPKRIMASDIDPIIYKFVTKDIDVKNDEERTAIKKYLLLNYVPLKYNLSDFCKKDNTLYKKGKGEQGVLVLTGQSAKRNPEKKGGKGLPKNKEFVFVRPSSPQTLEVDANTFMAFEFVHNSSKDYTDFWSRRLYKDNRVKDELQSLSKDLFRDEWIPVFFHKSGDKVDSIGLSYMYKLPYSMTVLDAVSNECNPLLNTERDLAECIFGTAAKDNSLKGRIHFGHAKVLNSPRLENSKPFYPGTPHASYYPLYVQNGYDWNKAKIINGRKRYPIRKSVWSYKGEGTEDMKQTTRMLPSNTKFEEKIFFFNLKPIELGAILSAITFHGNHKICFHNIGFGKPYGYGKAKITEVSLQSKDEIGDINYYMKSYEQCMQDFMKGKWLSSSQLNELLLMAQDGHVKPDDPQFRYLKFSKTAEDNEFKTCRDNREKLQKFSNIIGKSFDLTSIQTRPIENNNASESIPKETTTKYKKGDIVSATCTKESIIRIDGEDYDIKLSESDSNNPQSLVGKTLKVKIQKVPITEGRVTKVKIVEII